MINENQVQMLVQDQGQKKRAHSNFLVPHQNLGEIPDVAQIVPRALPLAILLWCFSLQQDMVNNQIVSSK